MGCFDCDSLVLQGDGWLSLIVVLWSLCLSTEEDLQHTGQLFIDFSASGWPKYNIQGFTVKEPGLPCFLTFHWVTFFLLKQHYTVYRLYMIFPNFNRRHCSKRWQIEIYIKWKKTVTPSGKDFTTYFSGISFYWYWWSMT